MKKYIYIGAGAVVILAIVGYYAFASHAPRYATAAVVRGSITQEASASGNVEAPTTIDLQFQNSGRLVSLGVDTGAKVSAGEVLARQDTSILSAQLAQAEAAVATQQANLASLLQGTRPEQLAVQETQVTNDQSALAQANQSVINAIQNAYTQSDDAVHNKVDQFFTNPQTSTPQVSFTSSNSQLISNVIADRESAGGMFPGWQTEVGSLGTSTDLSAAISEAQTNLTSVTQLLSDANAALNNAIAGQSANQASITGWIANVAIARANLNAAISALTSAVSAEQAAASALAKDQKSLALEQAGSTSATIDSQQAQVVQAEASVSVIKAQIAQTELVSPIDGVVTGVTGSVGETISPSVVVVSILPTSALQVNVNLSEDNIAGVAVGQPVSVSLDAFPSIVWQGTVAKIDPAETIIGGAVYYETTVMFDQPDARIKAGMTANVLIQTGAASSTLMVPASAIQTNDTSTFVEQYENGNITNQTVTTGLKSQSGMVEITSGLSEGELVVTGAQ
ncbi:MAG TPA: efflux RND transporter periplasmic adaptor subunit [Candidatus Paceibacterota bacterium]|nr:efflux RND transporter periplasmic adaptor subunit [Candidatus Paceibacterota bacterium]